jgi:transcriptional regulator with XRE-family HTH domain
VAKSVKSPDETDASVGEKIRTQRLLRGLSQTDLGKKVGITFQQIQKYEKGVNRVGAGRLHRIAKALGVPISFFFEGERGTSVEVEHINSSLRFLETAAAVRVVRAFAEIKGQKARRAIIALIEGVVQGERSGKRSRSG